MNIYYITGTSRGLGHAIASQLLKSEENLVIGIGRVSSIEHPNYKHKTLDLSDTVEVSKFRFGEHAKVDKVVLVNNAGTLGDINYLGEMENKNLVDALHINLVSPFILLNNFMKAYKREPLLQKVVLNISSGAAVNAYDGWSTYCTSKAGINMMSEVLKVEADLKNLESLKVLSVAPGIIETKMQEQIRSTSTEQFSMLEKFVELKENDQLQSPEETAVKLLNLLNSYEGNDVFLDLRNQG
jgi:benzil reductase ((S)-benzoin forming)